MRPFALWLIPAEPARSQLKATIETLARTHHGPVFQPHLTLYSGQASQPQSWLERLPALLRGVMATTVEVRELACSSEFFRAMVLELALHPLFDVLLDRCRDQQTDPSDDVLRPHVSLFYGHLKSAQQDQLRRVWQNKLPTELQFDRLQLVAPAGPEYRWSRVESWQLLGECPLQSVNLH